MISRSSGVCLTLALFALGCGSTNNPSGNTAFLSTTSMVLSPATVRLRAGATQQFNVVAGASDGSANDVSNQAQWNTSNAGAVTISNTGLATAQALTQVVPATTAIITAAFQSVTSGPGTVTVIPLTGTIQRFSAGITANANLLAWLPAQTITCGLPSSIRTAWPGSIRPVVPSTSSVCRREPRPWGFVMVLMATCGFANRCLRPLPG